MAETPSPWNPTKLAFDLVLGKTQEADPRLVGAAAIDAKRPGKGVIPNLSAWLLWIIPLGFLVLSLLSTPVPIVGEVLTLVFMHAVIVRVVTQKNESFTHKGIRRVVLDESRYRGLTRASLGILALGALVRLLAGFLFLIDGLGQPESEYGFQVMTPLWTLATVIGSIGSLICWIALLGIFVSAKRIGRTYAQHRKDSYALLRRFGSKDGILMNALGISSVSLEDEQSISFDGDEVIIDPVPIRARGNFSKIEENLIKYHLDDLMVHADSTPDRIILTLADEATRERRRNYTESHGLVLGMSPEDSSDDEILGRRHQGEVQL